MAKRKWYVVWKGHEPGVYATWDECKRQTDGYENALYKSFDSHETALEAINSSPWAYIGKAAQPAKTERALDAAIIPNSLSVDAACSGNPGKMEYRGVYTATGEELFHSPIFPQGTNNIGEFLAIVHALALLKKQGLELPIYTDSVNAMKWVKAKKCKTKLEPNETNAPLFDVIQRAEHWLQQNTYSTPIHKWDTNHWGEIPADFGRK